MNDAQLHHKALSLPLAQRYELYLNIYKSRTPRNPILAEDVVKLGRPARDYALKKARGASGAEFGAALTIISEFDVTCSESEYRMLLKTVEIGTQSHGQREALISRVGTACRRSTPNGWR